MTCSRVISADVIAPTSASVRGFLVHLGEDRPLLHGEGCSGCPPRLCSYLPPALQPCSLHFSHAGRLPPEPSPCSASAPGSYRAAALTATHLTSQSSSLACVSFSPEQKHHLFEAGFSVACPAGTSIAGASLPLLRQGSVSVLCCG